MEFVYVVNRTELFDLPFPHGFVGRAPPDGHPSLETYLERVKAHGYFVEREHAEQNSSLKQIIPYTLVLHGDQIFLVRRTSGGGEQRLYGKRSIGIGGHINPEDDSGDRADLVFQCARREMDEELLITAPYSIRPVGVINDDANPVGSVHFGVVLVAHLERAAAQVREQDALEGAFTPVRDARALLDHPDANFETWSSLILENLEDALVSGSA
ncbi:MAG: NUDIX domain-containing protein [bacterium]